MEFPVLSSEAIRTLCFQLGGWLLCLNAATHALAGIDRDRWAFGGQRMSETALLWLALIGGSPGLMLGMRRSRRVRYDYTFRGWIRAAVMTQVLFAALTVVPQGGLLVAAEQVAGFVLPDARAAERSSNIGRIVLDSQRGVSPLKDVVTLRADP